MRLAFVLALTAIVIGFLVVSVKVQKSEAWSGETIHIREDGNIDPTDAPIQRDGDIYTITEDINSSASGIVIERSNMTLDGADFTIQGSEFGISLDGRSNVTIKNINLKGFYTGVNCDGCSNISISECNIVGNGDYVSWGFLILHSSNITVYGNNVTNNERGLNIYDASNNSISKNNIFANLEMGILLSICSSSNVSLNNITDNKWGIQAGQYSNSNSFYENYIANNTVVGFAVTDSDDNNVLGNEITKNNGGVHISSSSGNNISGNCIVDNNYGINHDLSNYNNIIENNITATYGHGVLLTRSSYNNITRNNIIATNGDGIRLDISYSVPSTRNRITENLITESYRGAYLNSSSNYNVLNGNTIMNNVVGMLLDYSSNNSIWHNNIVNNMQQALNEGSINFWDDGIEGNYWSDYNFGDSNHDGIGDSPYSVTDPMTTPPELIQFDNYPLMGIFHSFHISSNCTVNVVSNSTIEDFLFFDLNGTIRMHVSNMTTDQAFGFCRICIPHSLMNVSSISVIIDGGLTPVIYQNYTLYDDETNRWIYFAHPHSIHEIIIIPESTSFLTILILMTATLLTSIIFRKRHVLTANSK